MGKFRDGMERFMRGRYGTDQLNNALIALGFILMFIGLIVRSGILSLVTWVILVLVIYRSLSRNGHKRSLENDRFMKIWTKIAVKLSLTFRRIKEIRTARFRRCPHCGAVLRLPRRVGKHTAVCPRCKKEFDIRIRL